MATFFALPTVREFIAFSVVGGGTFFLNLATLYVLTTFLHVHYLIAVPLSFALGSFIHFVFAKEYIFTESAQTFNEGLFLFILIAAFDATIITLGTAGLITYLNLNLYIARTIMSGISALLNFFLNARYNFKVL